MKRLVQMGVAAAAVFTAACSDGDSFGPDVNSLSYVTQEVCETITFNTTAGATDHGALWGGTTLFGVSVTASGTRFVDPVGANGGAIAPRLFYSPIQTDIEDDDLQYPAVGDCQDCQDLNLQNILVIPDNRAHATPFYWGDYRYGGNIQLDFAAGLDAGTYYVKSWHAVDDDGGEPSIDLFADNVLVSASVGTGDATVETVNSASKIYFTSALRFQFGSEAQDEVTGSGGIDNVVVCKDVEVPSEGTRTPGYWKNDKKPWPTDNITIGGVLYTRAQADALMEAPTAGDKTYNLFEHLVAAKLNLLSGTDPSCISTAVAEADAWLTTHQVGSGVKASSSAWKNPEGGNTMSAADLLTTLDAYNNGLLCAPHAD